jgi:hypothetical protein
MYSYRAFSVLIKDFPNLPKEKKYIEFSGHRFRCISSGETITEDIPCQCPFTRVTWEMAWWIIHLLKGHMSISTLSDFYLLIIHPQNFREKPIIPSFSIFFPKTKKQRAKARCFQKTGQNILLCSGEAEYFFIKRQYPESILMQNKMFNAHLPC